MIGGKLKIKMKKILYVTTLSCTINAFLVSHIKFLIQNKGYKVDIAANIDVEVSEELLNLGVRVFNIDFQRNPLGTKNVVAYKQIQAVQEKEKYDVVNVHTPVAAFITRIALRNYKNVKVIYTCHGFHFYKGAPLLNWLIYYPLEKIAAKWTDCITTINKEDFERAQKFRLRNKGSIFKINGVGIEASKYLLKDFDYDVYRKNLELGINSFVILILAELNKNKNHYQIIEAIKLLNNKYPDIKAVFAGTGHLEEDINRKIKEYSLEENIKLLGWRNDVKELINTSDLVGLFSKREGFGKCLLEAMICGKPVVATRTRGPKELIIDSYNGFLVEINNYEETAKIIERLYLDKELRVNLGKNSTIKSNQYSIESVLAQLDSIYTTVLTEEDIIMGEVV